MKTILLLGDSISIGYREVVKDAFSGIAQVVYPEENGRTASNLLRRLYDYKEMLSLDKVDLIHWNAGLWDTLYLPDGKIQTTLARYRSDIVRIARTLAILFPKAKQVFATSTPVLENEYQNHFLYYRRYNRDVMRYNETALAALAPFGIEVNDLFSEMVDAPKEYHSDTTHFNTEAGTRRIAGAVIRSIAKHADLSPKETTSMNFTRENLGI